MCCINDYNYILSFYCFLSLSLSLPSPYSLQSKGQYDNPKQENKFVLDQDRGQSRSMSASSILPNKMMSIEKPEIVGVLSNDKEGITSA